jgi:para-aminobenzoate synthetase component 1
MIDAMLSAKQVISFLPYWQKKFEVKDLNTVFFLTSNQYPKTKYEFVIGLGKLVDLSINDKQQKQVVFKQLVEKADLWKFPIVAYDYKNQIENLTSKNPKKYPSDDASFYIPEIVITCKNGIWESFNQSKKKYCDIDFPLNIKEEEKEEENFTVESLSFPSFEVYAKSFSTIQQHLYRGNIYETNFCNLFEAEINGSISPEKLFIQLNELSPMPMACFVKLDQLNIICASPERYLQKQGNSLLSSPIKGSARRGKDKLSDEEIESELLHSEKERAENVMIVDLVRNDLSKLAQQNSVKTEALFRIEKLPNIFQMVSDVSCRIGNDVSFGEILDATFPMGSMTGAPKISAMQIMDKIESFRRGIYSGAIGYIAPNGDFDLNVVIRTVIQYQNYLYYPVGSAVTAYAEASKEYEECLLKAKAFFTLLQQYGFNAANSPIFS